MEGTAAWMEDQVYDGVNDNRQYLAQSPLSDPYLPLDFSTSTYLPYGNWIFWRFLSEWTGRGSLDYPSIVRQVWSKARSTYSTNALKQVLTAHKLTFGRTFTTFGTWNRNPAKYYSEGASYHAAPLDGSFKLTTAHKSTGTKVDQDLSHMSHGFIRFTPGASLTGTWRLKVAVNMPNTVRGSLAQLTVHRPSGAEVSYPVKLTSKGVGAATVSFKRSKVKFVELDLVNASTRFTCNQGTDWSCGGVGRDDNLDSTFSAKTFR